VAETTGGPLALYFGPLRVSGHFLWKEEWGGSTLNPEEYGCPWGIGLMDTGLLKNGGVPDMPDGRVYWTCGGKPDLWFAFFWWDRSVDKRGASNSGFYVRGFGPESVTTESVEEAAPAAFTFACETWPGVVARQRFPLVLK
jgi:hypothetical protein